MDGGIVIEVVTRSDYVYINCRSDRYRDECAMHVERNPDSERIEFGDRIWWQGPTAFWTPADVRESGVGKSDIEIPRRGYSGVSHPTRS